MLIPSGPGEPLTPLKKSHKIFNICFQNYTQYNLRITFYTESTNRRYTVNKNITQVIKPYLH